MTRPQRLRRPVSPRWRIQDHQLGHQPALGGREMFDVARPHLPRGKQVVLRRALSAPGAAGTARRGFALRTVVSFYRDCGLIWASDPPRQSVRTVSHNISVLRGVLRTATCGFASGSEVFAELSHLVICESALASRGCDGLVPRDRAGRGTPVLGVRRAGRPRQCVRCVPSGHRGAGCCAGCWCRGVGRAQRGLRG